MKKNIHIHIHQTTHDAMPDNKERLEKELDEVQAKIEALEDRGVSIPSSLSSRRKFLQEQLKGLEKLRGMQQFLKKGVDCEVV